MKKIFTQPNKDTLGKVVSLESIHRALSAATSAASGGLSRKPYVFGIESFDSTDPKLTATQKVAVEDFTAMRDSLKNALVNEFGAPTVDKLFSTETISAATLALAEANGAGNVKDGRPDLSMKSGADGVVLRGVGPKGTKISDIVGQERFDNNARFSAYRITTTALQLVNSRQVGYIDLVFPSTVTGFNDTGFTIEVPRGTIQDELYVRNADASPKNIRKVGLVYKYRNAMDEMRHANRLYPVVSAAWKGKLTETYGTRTVTTFTGEQAVSAPIKLGQSVDYIKISTPPGYTGGTTNDTDVSLAPGGCLETIYVKFGEGDVIAIPVSGDSQGARFVWDNTNGRRGATQHLNYRNTFSFDKTNIKGVDGTTDSPALAKLVANDQSVLLTVRVGATLDLENGELSSSTVAVTIAKVKDAGGADVKPENYSADQKAFSTLDAKPVDAEFDIRRSNSNMEVLGDIVYVDYHNIHLESTWNHPVSLQMPVNGEDSPELLVMMKKAIDVYKHNMSTFKLVDGFERIKNASQLPVDEAMDTWGKSAGALCYIPYYNEMTLDITQALVNERSGEFIQDVAGIISAALKDEISLMLTNTAYVQEINGQYIVGATQSGVKIGIVTSQRVADWITYAIEHKMMGHQYEVEVQINPASLFDNQIYLFPTTTDNGKSEISPLQWGIGLNSPDIVYDATRTLDGNKTIKEVRYINRFTPYVLGCAAAKITISNLSNAIAKRVSRSIVIEADNSAKAETPAAGE